MPSSTATRRAVPSDYILRGRDSMTFGMQHTLKPTKSRSFTLNLDPARRLDMEAAIELQHGHIQAAEMLARRAAELREARQ